MIPSCFLNFCICGRNLSYIMTMIHFRQKLIFLCFISVVFFSLSGCAATKKIQAGKILSQTSLSFQSIQLDSIVLHPELFEKINSLKTTFFPNPQVLALVQKLANGIIDSELGSVYLNIELELDNKSKDSLWLHGLNAVLELDSSVHLPVTLPANTVLKPGSQLISVKTNVKLDQNLLKLIQIKKARIIGEMNVSLKESAPPLPLDFDYSRDISPEEVDLLQRKARETIMNHIVGDWVKAIL